MNATMTQEKAELLQALAERRAFLRQTVQGLDEAQLRQRSTASELTLASLIKHVTSGERQWCRFMQQGPSAIGDFNETTLARWVEEWKVPAELTGADLLADYERAASETEAVVTGLADLNEGHPLPSAPWFEAGAVWSARTTLLHLIGETAQHAGHADIIRESIDGSKTMG